MPQFTDQASDQYIDNVTWIAVVGGGLAFFISTCFMNVFDTVGETILYCFASEQRRRRNLDKRRGGLYKSGKTVTGTMTGIWNLFFGSDSEDEDDHVDYAPAKLKEVIKEARDEQGY